MRKMKLKLVSLLLLICMLAQPGCARLKSGEYQTYGYKGTAEIKEGWRIWPLDVLGNIVGILGKIILFNWKVERHRITEPTKLAVDEYLKENADRLGNLAIQYNRYAPQDAWRRLFSNKRVKWPYRYTIGLLTVLIVDTILINRIFGGDHYNPFTHTMNLYSDLPSIALHELGHAKDFSGRRYRGSYAFLRVVPFTDLYQEYIATETAFDYIDKNLQTKDLYHTKVESYNVLYPAYGTYVGRYIFGFGALAGVLIGHIWGRTESSSFKRKHPKEFLK